ncbi:TPA: hypothetical protein ENS27_05080 [bacterium]|nr:hypothetical protein [bacterium]
MLLSLSIALIITGSVQEISPIADEFDIRDKWVSAKIKTEPSFSFNYNGKSSDEFLQNWNITCESEKIDEIKTKHEITYSDPETNLTVTCKAVEYSDFPIVEWTLYFKNNGSKDTPIISDIQAIDTVFEKKDNEEFILNHNTGSPCRADD